MRFATIFAALILLANGSTWANPPATATDVQPLPGPASQPASTSAYPGKIGTTQPAGGVAATPAAPAVDANAIAELLKLLGNRSYDVREDATKKLIAMGEPVQALLKAKLKEPGLDPEVANRIETVLEKTSPLKREVTDEKTGITVSIQPDGSIAAMQNGRMLWRIMALRPQPTSLKLQNGQVIVTPGDSGIDLATGKLLWMGRP